jgi:hypothetical protein
MARRERRCCPLVDPQLARPHSHTRLTIVLELQVRVMALRLRDFGNTVEELDGCGPGACGGRPSPTAVAQLRSCAAARRKTARYHLRQASSRCRCALSKGSCSPAMKFLAVKPRVMDFLSVAMDHAGTARRYSGSSAAPTRGVSLQSAGQRKRMPACRSDSPALSLGRSGPDAADRLATMRVRDKQQN